MINGTTEMNEITMVTGKSSSARRPEAGGLQLSGQGDKVDISICAGT